jgi:hypothetical protein
MKNGNNSNGYQMISKVSQRDKSQGTFTRHSSWLMEALNFLCHLGKHQNLTAPEIFRRTVEPIVENILWVLAVHENELDPNDQVRLQSLLEATEGMKSWHNQQSH